MSRIAVFGMVMSERTPQEAAKTISEGLTKNWDRSVIRRGMTGRSWGHIAEAVFLHLSQPIPGCKPIAESVPVAKSI